MPIETFISVSTSDKLGLVKSIKALEKILPGPDKDITYLCIGSDLSTGDCFGPLTGTLLKNLGIKNVVGSLDDTVHAANLEEKLLQIPGDSYIVAIDSMMGNFRDIGNLIFIRGPIRPGAALNKGLPPVGDVSVVLNVASNSLANFLTLGCVSLNRVWTGSNLLYRAICVFNHRRNSIKSRPPGGAAVPAAGIQNSEFRIPCRKFSSIGNEN
ncbi:MAG: spore protease YyaC [Bacillota bacterium]